MHKIALTLLAAFVLGLGIAYVYPTVLWAGESPWQLRVNKDGIEVSTRKVGDSPILEFKSNIIIDAPIEKVIALYEDAKQLPVWFHQCVGFEQVEKEGPEGGIFYFVIHLPWPVAERDAVFRRLKSTDLATGQITYTLSALPQHLPQRKGRVRMPYLKTNWRFTPLPNGQTEVFFQQHSDAGGSIPIFIVNKLVVDIPFNSLKNLRKLIMNQKS